MRRITTDEWAKKLNEIGAELDSICASLHPSVWQYDPDIEKLQRKWRELAKQPMDDRRQPRLPGLERETR